MVISVQGEGIESEGWRGEKVGPSSRGVLNTSVRPLS